VKAERTQALSAIKSTIVDRLAEEFPDKLREIAEVIEGIEYDTMRERVLTAGERVDGRDLDTVRRLPARWVGCRARTAPRCSPRADPGARLGDVGHDGRRAAYRLDRRRAGNDEVVHAALQLPALLDRRSEAGARHVAARDRPRRAGGAGVAGGAAAL